MRARRRELRARGEYDPAKYGPGNEKPLTAAEHLEVLATGEMLARYYRHPARVNDAVKAGATWEQIGDTRGTTAARVRRDYREWAASQHRLGADYDGRFGLSDTEHGESMTRSADPGTYPGGIGDPTNIGIHSGGRILGGRAVSTREDAERKTGDACLAEDASSLLRAPSES